MPEVLPLDTSVRMPAAVAATIAKANAIHGEVYAAETPPSADGAAGEPPTKTDPATEPTTNLGQEPTFTGKVTHQGNDATDWKHRYESMKGRYDSEVPRLRGDLADALARSTALTREVETLRSQLDAMAAAPATGQPQKLLTDDEIKDYGSDFLNVVGKRAKEEISPDVDALKQEIADLRRQLSGVGAHVEQTEREKLYGFLDKRIANWRDINTSPNFLSWLDLPDPYSGVIRRDMLKAAFERNDSPRVAAFFGGFLAEEAVVGPADGGEPDQGGDAKPRKASDKVPLETFAAPGRAKSAATQSVPAEKPFITRSEISKFYDDVRRGLYNGKEADKFRIEQMISEASREGRVR